MDEDLAPDPITSAVLEVLAGAALDQAAAHASMTPTDLAEAVEMYHAAGRASLQARAASCGWLAVRIQPADWDAAEHAAATHLGPHLQQAQTIGTLATWWFVRKHPCWRLRLYPGPTATVGDLEAAFGRVLDSLTKAGVLVRWWNAMYEPETVAFGGPTAMDIAHTLFHSDSSNFLNYLRNQNLAARPRDILGRRELSILLCSNMFRAAGQDWYEQGDIWDRVARTRPLPSGIPTDRLPGMTEEVRRLLTVDTRRLLDTGGSLGFGAPWAASFHDAGRDLADAAQDGILLRGTRDVLAHHVIFHWNRLGLSATTQAILARAARDAVMTPSRTTGGC